MEPKKEEKKKFKGVSVYLTPEVQKRLKVLAANEETTVTALIEEGILDLFKKRETKKA